MSFTWEDRLDYTGMLHEVLQRSEVEIVVRVRFAPGGLAGIGRARTLDDALHDAVLGFPICWRSVERRMTDDVWSKIAHE